MIKIFFSVCLLALIITEISCGKTVIKDTGGDVNGGGAIIKTGNPGTEKIKDGKYTGGFGVAMSGYRGEIFIKEEKGQVEGTIMFYNWGNGTPQPLKNIKISGNKIYFKRSITTKDELVRYGGTDYFEQDFYGIFSGDWKVIKGYYRFTGTQDNWEAIKK